MLRVTEELRRVLAPHGSICIELGDTYAGSGGAGGDYDAEGLRAGQPKFRQQPPNTAHRLHDDGSLKTDSATRVLEGKNVGHLTPLPAGPGWPLSKSKALIAELYRVGLAYGINPLTGSESPAGRWRVRNVVTWVRPNPPVGALGDKWRPATSDLVIACTSAKRYWDDLATRRPFKTESHPMGTGTVNGVPGTAVDRGYGPSGAPLLDWWEIPPGGYKGSHYAVYPEELVVPCVQAMAPPKVCRTCGESSRRITETTNAVGKALRWEAHTAGVDASGGGRTDILDINHHAPDRAEKITLGWSDCGHDDWRPGLILDPFAGSGTTLAVATGYGHDAIGIDLDPRNAELALQRVGPFLLEVDA